MKGFIRRAAGVLCCAAAIGGAGCYGYRDLVDPCYPQRYEAAARQEVAAALGPQEQNGHVLDQTVWNYDFEPGTDVLTPGGWEQLAYIARRRPAADPVVYVQTAADVVYDPAAPDQMALARADLDAKRVAAVQKFLTVQAAGRPHADFQVLVHDPSDVTVSGAWAGNAYGQMVTTRPRGGLPTGGGGGVSGGVGASPGAR